MQTKSRAVVLALFDEVELLDVASALAVLTTAGRQWNFRPFKVLTAALVPGLLTTRDQIRLEAACVLGDSTAEILVVPGGYGARRAADDPAFVAALGRATNAGTTVLAFGQGLLPAARAGALRGAEVAATEETGKLLQDLDETLRVNTAARWLESGRTFSAANSGAAVEATIRLVASVLGERQAAIVSAALGLETAPPKVTVDIKLPL